MWAGGAGLRFVRARAIFCNMARPNSVPERVLLAVLRRQKALGIGHATSAFSSCRHAAVHALVGSGPCVDGSGLASAFFTRAGVVVAAMCSAC